MSSNHAFAPGSKLEKWFPEGSFLRPKDFPDFHTRLKKKGRGDLSYKISRCCSDGVPLECISNETHGGHVPVRCNRRICPDCAKRFMASAIEQYRPIFLTALTASSYKLRFHTFTMYAKDGKPLRKPLEIMNAAIRLWWRYEYGDLSKISSNAGGLFGMEIGRGWNVHCHALILGPYRRVENQRALFQRCISHYGGFSLWYHITQATPTEESLVELVQYPLNPHKMDHIPEDLLAEIECGFSGDRERKQPAIRRIWTTGSFYNQFKKPEAAHCTCPICQSDMHLGEPSLFGDKLRRLHPDYFSNPARWSGRLRATKPLTNAKKDDAHQ